MRKFIFDGDETNVFFTLREMVDEVEMTDQELDDLANIKVGEEYNGDDGIKVKRIE